MTTPLPAKDLDAARRVVVLWIGRLGDFLITTPILRSIRLRFPKARVTLVVGEKGREIAALCPSVDRILTLHTVTSPLSNLRLAAALVSEPSDLVIDLNSSASRASSALAWIARAPIKLAFEKDKGNWAFTRLLPAPSDTEHMLDRYGRLATALDAPYDPTLCVDIPADRMDEADAILRNAWKGAPATGTAIAIHPGNFKKFDNRWPEDKFVELTDRLARAGYGRVLFLSGPGEEKEIAALVGRLATKTPILAPMSVGLTAAVLSQVDLLIVNATGTAHLAVAVGTPTFSFLGRYTKTIWMPRSGPHYDVVSESWESCRDIPVDIAWRALSDVLPKLPPRGSTRQ